MKERRIKGSFCVFGQNYWVNGCATGWDGESGEGAVGSAGVVSFNFTVFHLRRW